MFPAIDKYICVLSSRFHGNNVLADLKPTPGRNVSETLFLQVSYQWQASVFIGNADGTLCVYALNLHCTMCNFYKVLERKNISISLESDPESTKALTKQQRRGSTSG